MSLRTMVLFAAATLLLSAPLAAADEDDKETDGDGEGSTNAQGRGCRVVPFRVQDVECQELESACESFEGPNSQGSCQQLMKPKPVCLSVTKEPEPGISYDVDCWTTYVLRQAREILGDWRIKVDMPERY